MYSDIACIQIASDFYFPGTPSYGSDRPPCHDIIIPAGLLNTPKHAALFAAIRTCYRCGV